MISEVHVPGEVGVNFIPNFLERFEPRLANEGPTVNCGLLDVTELMVRVVFAALVTVILSVLEVPTSTMPRESVHLETVKLPLACGFALEGATEDAGAAGTFPCGEVETS